MLSVRVEGGGVRLAEMCRKVVLYMEGGCGVLAFRTEWLLLS